ncbi:unnamed protein product [Symbiodinium microadriaticum]|nr:unnamed protein product [Symbiodinium microadriaticum]
MYKYISYLLRGWLPILVTAVLSADTPSTKHVRQVVKFAFSHQQNLREINCGSGSGVTISAERRTGVNRALRHLSNKLPGCCWTVGQTREEIHVFLADAARFSKWFEGGT